MKYHSDNCPECGGDLMFDTRVWENGSLVQDWVCTNDACEAEGHDWYEPGARLTTRIKGEDLDESKEYPPTEAQP